ncbi:DNA polymerase beta superfamily protein [Metabacillus malikii]|uniref:Nucleotidyltransferase n=1 Tax=Metabacillus malikii TaxID=1504265 RepID=A0ABT9ZC84_9BACI|nr:nucleotidyltransferase domain-containing protein [Metabacillus malikii]MDQ0229447.1 putative nucleotidyltransferase [Metabacillus malikii]
MKSIILKELNRIELQENIQILYSCEAGSRFWGTDSPDSDYDVRFIYVRKVHSYLKINEERDVIEVKLSPNIEIVGWDLKKTLKLIKKSNPSLQEWVSSPLHYKLDDNILDSLKLLTSKAFSLRTTIYHYVNMAKKSYLSMKKESNNTTKRYINCIRPILICFTFIQHNERPNYDFITMCRQVIKDEVVYKQLQLLHDAKKEGQPNFSSDMLLQFIEEAIPQIENHAHTLSHQPLQIEEELNQFFLSVLKKTNPAFFSS